MFDQLKQFVSNFRELEKRELVLTPDEEDRWKKLKEKLAASGLQEKSNQPLFHRVIAVASFYPQAGSSFLASNFAFFQASKEIQTTLCEIPSGISYYYFALDSERRAVPDRGQTREEYRKIQLLNGALRIKVTASLVHRPLSQGELSNWFLTNSKESSLFIIDLSSHWRGEPAEWIMELADQVWFILDSDFPRLSRLILSETAPAIWQKNYEKIKIVANKWNGRLASNSVVKKIEGTLSFWDTELQSKKVDAFFPLIKAEKISSAQLEAVLLLEKYPEEGLLFEQLACI